MKKVAFGTEGGTTVNIPFWNDLSGEVEVLSDGKLLGGK